MHIHDMVEFDIETGATGRLLAVGWLEIEHSFPIGTPKDGFFQALFSLALNPWQPAHSAGGHLCSLCRFTGGPNVVRYRNKEVAIGSANIYVPTENEVFIAPSTIVHYVDTHGYCPPAEFQDAVMSCPEMRSMPYLKLLSKNGVRSA